MKTSTKVETAYDFEIEIPGELPTRNQERNADKGNKYGGSNMKKQAEKLCAAKALSLPAMEAIQGEIIFYRSDRKTDPDNIISAIKYIFDGLESAGVIPNDGWRNVKPKLKLDWRLDKHNPRTVVRLKEVEAGLGVRP